MFWIRMWIDWVDNAPIITCRWFSHGSPSSSSRTAVRIGSSLVKTLMTLSRLSLTIGVRWKPGQWQGNWSRRDKSRVGIWLCWVWGFDVVVERQGRDRVVVSHPVQKVSQPLPIKSGLLLENDPSLPYTKPQFNILRGFRSDLHTATKSSRVSSLSSTSKESASRCASLSCKICNI